MDSGMGTPVENPMDPTGVNPVNLHDILVKKFRLRQKVIKTQHHISYLQECARLGQVPKGLAIQQQVQLMDSPKSNDTRAQIKDIIQQTEQQIVNTITSHYREVLKDTQEQLRTTEESARGQASGTSSETRVALQDLQARLERAENSLRVSLEEKRNKKLMRLTPRTHTNPHIHATSSHTPNTLMPQARGRRESHTPNTLTPQARGRREFGGKAPVPYGRPQPRRHTSIPLEPFSPNHCWTIWAATH